jgi:hypothetical protein
MTFLKRKYLFRSEKDFNIWKGFDGTLIQNKKGKKENMLYALHFFTYSTTDNVELNNVKLLLIYYILEIG